MNNVNTAILSKLRQMLMNIFADEVTRDQSKLPIKWLQVYIYNINQALQIALSGNEKCENPKYGFEETKKLVNQVNELANVNKRDMQSDTLKMMENKDLQTEEQNLSEIENIMQNLGNQYEFFDFLLMDVSDENLREIYKHRRSLDKYLEKRVPRKIKEEIETVKKSSGEDFNELLKATMDAINEISFKTGYGTQTVIRLLKINVENEEIKTSTDLLLKYSEKFQNIINAKKPKEEENDKTKSSLNKNESSEKEAIPENTDKISTDNEENSEKGNESSKEKIETEPVEEQKSASDVAEQKTKKSNRAVIKSDKSDSIEFEEYLSNISQIQMAKENVLPVFLHIYSRENGGFFDFFPKEKIKEFYRLLDRYEKQDNRSAKIFIFTNKDSRAVNRMMREIQIFEKEYGKRRLEGGISKYGTYFLDIEGKEIPLVKMDEENYKIGKKELSKIINEKFIDEYLDKDEKNFWSFKFPKDYGKGVTLRTYDLLRKGILRRKNEVEVLGFADGEKGIDVILKSQVKAKDKISRFCKTKFYVKENYGVSFAPRDMDEVLQKFEERLAEEER